MEILYWSRTPDSNGDPLHPKCSDLPISPMRDMKSLIFKELVTYLSTTNQSPNKTVIGSINFVNQKSHSSITVRSMGPAGRYCSGILAN